VGDLLENILGRHSWRPAHLHFKIDADGYQPLTTQLYFAGDPYLDSDCGSAVKDSLVIDPAKETMAARPTAGGTCSGRRRPDRPARHSSSPTAPIGAGVGLTALRCVKPGETVTEPAAFLPAMCRTRPGSDVVDCFTAPRASCPATRSLRPLCAQNWSSVPGGQ
jgi:Dioxygenase